jgi:hypothetical protein
MVLRGGRRYDRAIGTYSNSPLPRRDRHRVRRHLDPTVAPIPEIILAGRGHLRIRGFGVGPAATGPDRCRADQRPGGALRARAGSCCSLATAPSWLTASPPRPTCWSARPPATARSPAPPAATSSSTATAILLRCGRGGRGRLLSHPRPQLDAVAEQGPGGVRRERLSRILFLSFGPIGCPAPPRGLSAYLGAR